MHVSKDLMRRREWKNLRSKPGLAFSLKVVVCAFCQSEHSQPLQDGLARCRATARDDMDDWCAGRGWNYKPRCHVRKGLKDNSEHFRKMPSFNLISKVNRESAYQIRRSLSFFSPFPFCCLRLKVQTFAQANSRKLRNKHVGKVVVQQSTERSPVHTHAWPITHGANEWSNWCVDL